ncbi:60S ribosomal protein L10a-3-like isoform X1 [Hibiscus syriacus]|uniref:60S ribosomal protein L10a-3-like isoform X1 n=1 Tax=Hibiscus syriacus TaxID=106335 RepID=A0A6A2ZJN2_HIBSY|nr:60S ribosomal protein L10a-3-like isoform X1 [Hibiscus syriacus]
MTTMSLTSPYIVKAAIPNQFTGAVIKAPRSLGSVKSISKSFGLKCSSNCRTSMYDQMVRRAKLKFLMINTLWMQPRKLDQICLIPVRPELAPPVPERWFQVLLINPTVPR